MACRAMGEEPAQDDGGAGGEVAGEGGVAAPAGVDEDSEIAGFLRDLVGGEETSTLDDHPDAGRSENSRVCPGARLRSWPWQPTRTGGNSPGPLLTRIVWSAMLRVISWSR